MVPALGDECVLCVQAAAGETEASKAVGLCL